MSKPLVVDLCCGLGGWTRGFVAEGYDAIGFDIERHVYGDKRYPAQLVLQWIARCFKPDAPMPMGIAAARPGLVEGVA
jgi:hypothetical protein